MDKVISRGLNFVVFIYLATVLTPADFGTVAVARIFIDYLDSLSDQGLFFALVQRKRLTKKHIDTSLLLLVGLASALALVISILATLIGQFYENSELVNVIQILALMMVVNAINRVPYALIVREQNYKKLFMNNFFVSFGNASVGISMALNGFGVWALVGQQFAHAFLGLIALTLATGWRPGLQISKRAALVLYRFSFKLVIDQQFQFFSKKVDEFLVSLLYGLSTLGMFTLAKKFLLPLMDLLLGSFTRVVFSSLSRLQNKPKQFEESIALYLRWVLSFLGPVVATLATTADLFIPMLFGEKWSGVELVVSVLVATVFVSGISAILHQGFIATGNTSAVLRSNTWRIVVFLLSVSFLTRFGLVGVGVAVFLKDIVGLCIDVYYVKSRLRIDLRNIFHNILKGTFPAMFACVAVLYFRFSHSFDNYSNTNLLVICAVSAFFASSITILLFERKLVKRIFWKYT